MTLPRGLSSPSRRVTLSSFSPFLHPAECGGEEGFRGFPTRNSMGHRNPCPSLRLDVCPPFPIRRRPLRPWLGFFRQEETFYILNDAADSIWPHKGGVKVNVFFFFFFFFFPSFW